MREFYRVYISFLCLQYLLRKFITDDATTDNRANGLISRVFANQGSIPGQVMRKTQNGT